MTQVKGKRGVPPENLSGQTFNRLTAIGLDLLRTKRTYWLCKCECGNEVSVTACDLKSGHTKSCGCFNQQSRVQNNTRHGYSRSPTYVVWTNLISRCTNSKRHDYKNYGGRGITVCDRWASFENFLADMGEKPPKLSIDRIDNNAGYSPENCRWATASEQRKNQRKVSVRAAAAIGKEMKL